MDDSHPPPPKSRKGGKGLKRKPGQKRTRDGCLVCRSSRVRCPGAKPVCERCLRLEFDCHWPVEEPRESQFQPFPVLPLQVAGASARAGSSPSVSSSAVSSPQRPGSPPPSSPAALAANSLAAPSFPLNPFIDDFGRPTALSVSSISSAWIVPLESADIAATPRPSSPTLNGLVASPLPPSHRRQSSVRSPPPDSTAQWLPPEVSWALSAPLFSEPTHPLELAFPNPEERALLRHFLNIAHILTGTLPSPGALTIPRAQSALTDQSTIEKFFPSIDAQRFLFSPRGSSIATDALAMAMFSVARIHISFLHHSSALLSLVSSQPSAAELSISQAASNGNASSAFISASISLSRAGLLLAATQPPSPDREHELDFLAGAAFLCVLTKCLAGGRGSGEAQALNHDVVKMRGGPVQLLEDARKSGDRTRFRRMRSMLELYAITDVFSSLASGEVPNAFSDATPISSWIFDHRDGYDPQVSTVSQELEELVIAISMTRVVFELITRINKLYSDSHPRPNPGVKTPDSMSIEPHWIAQAQNLMIELTELRAKRTRGFIDMNNNPEAIDVHKRVLLGDLIWCHSLEIILRIDLLSQSPSDQAVYQLARASLDLVYEGQRSCDLVFGVLWPLLIAGGIFTTREDRERCRIAMEGLRTEIYCFDLESAFQILFQVWALRDAGNERASWRDVQPAPGEAWILM